MISLFELLVETYSSVTLRISRDIINDFKLNVKKGGKYKYDGKIISRDPEMKSLAGEPDDIEFKVYVHFEPTRKMHGHSYSIDAITVYDIVNITMSYNPTVFPAAYNDFIAEVKEAVRHEVEHIAQNFNQGKEQHERSVDGEPYYQYLQLRHEVPAFVQGLYRRSKSKKQTLTTSIDEFMKENSDSFRNKKEKRIVKTIWIEWAKKNLKNAQL